MRRFSIFLLTLSLLAGASGCAEIRHATDEYDIRDTQTRVNANTYVSPKPDEDTWHRFVNGKGACTSFALAKYGDLEKEGMNVWIMVYVSHNEFHAVTIVNPDGPAIGVKDGRVAIRGSVLDQRTNAVLPFDWYHLPEGGWGLYRVDPHDNYRRDAVAYGEGKLIRFAFVSGEKVIDEGRVLH